MVVGTFAFSKRDFLDPKEIAKALFISRDDLAWTAGLEPASLRRQAQVRDTETQRRLRELVAVLGIASSYYGSPNVAYAWTRAQSLPEFDGRTAMHLIHEGRAAELLNYLDISGADAFG